MHNTRSTRCLHHAGGVVVAALLSALVAVAGGRTLAQVPAKSAAAEAKPGALKVVAEFDVPIPMRDGVILRANVFRPSQGGPYPVLVYRTPYGKKSKVDAGLVRAGFIVVSQDARGRYASDGVFESFNREETHDAEDGFDTVAWAAKMPNSNGKVGLVGTSYPAFLAWRAAAAQPPALVAMAAWSIPATMTDLEGPGTIRPGRRLKWWQTNSSDLRRKAGGPEPHTNAEAVKAWNAGEGEKLLSALPWSSLPDHIFAGEAPVIKAWLREPWRDPWKLADDAKRTKVPNLNVCGWYDHCNGSIDLHTAIYKHGGSYQAQRFSRLIVGPWSHSGLGKRRQGEIDFGPAAQVDLNALTQEWFTHFFTDRKENVEHWAPVRLFVMGVNEWRDYYQWPPQSAQPRRWQLTGGGHANTPRGDGRLVEGLAPSAGKPAATSDSYDYDPRNPVPTLWSSSMFTLPADQKPLADRRDILVYQSQPLDDYVETIGYPEVVLHASSDRADTDFFVRLIDVAPDGRAIDISSGMVRARYRNSLKKPELLKPGEPTEFHIRMRPTAHRFLVGHRIRLDVTSSDFPNYDRNHNTAADQNADAELVVAHNTVYHTELRSELVLPVMPPPGTPPKWSQDAPEPPPKFVKQWGTEGTGPGEFRSPIGLAIDGNDQIYVAEAKNNRVQVFDTDGKFLRQFPVAEMPGGIAVDAQGDVYVAPLLQHKICVYDRTGKLTREWGKAGTGPGEFNQPGGIAVAADGSIFVADQANHRIQKFTRDGKFLQAWGTFGEGLGDFGGKGKKGSRVAGPHFLAFDAAGRLYTTEGAQGRVQVFEPDGRSIRGWGGNAPGVGTFAGREAIMTNTLPGPVGITIDRHGRVWVSSTNNRVQCFTADGEFLTGIGDEGVGPGEFVIPHGLVFDSLGYLYVADAVNQRIQKFSVAQPAME